MEKKITISVKKDIYEKFYLALDLLEEDESEALETCLKWYIAKSFGRVSRKYEKDVVEKHGADLKPSFYGKAEKRIPLWAKHPEQYCHKIIRAYFQCKEQNGKVSLQELENLCSDENVPELYVPTFRNNYYQMKTDAAKTYGKVFEEDENGVKIWKEIEDVLMKYKSAFL